MQAAAATPPIPVPQAAAASMVARATYRVLGPGKYAYSWPRILLLCAYELGGGDAAPRRTVQDMAGTTTQVKRRGLGWQIQAAIFYVMDFVTGWLSLERKRFLESQRLLCDGKEFKRGINSHVITAIQVCGLADCFLGCVHIRASNRLTTLHLPVPLAMTASTVRHSYIKPRSYAVTHLQVTQSNRKPSRTSS